MRLVRVARFGSQRGESVYRGTQLDEMLKSGDPLEHLGAVSDRGDKPSAQLSRADADTGNVCGAAIGDAAQNTGDDRSYDLVRFGRVRTPREHGVFDCAERLRRIARFV